MKLTKDQQRALKRILERDVPIPELNQRQWFRRYRSLRRQVHPGPGCVMVPRWNMWLGIEPDGYTHS